MKYMISCCLSGAYVTTNTTQGEKTERQTHPLAMAKKLTANYWQVYPCLKKLHKQGHFSVKVAFRYQPSEYIFYHDSCNLFDSSCVILLTSQPRNSHGWKHNLLGHLWACQCKKVTCYMFYGMFILLNFIDSFHRKKKLNTGFLFKCFHSTTTAKPSTVTLRNMFRLQWKHGLERSSESSKLNSNLCPFQTSSEPHWTCQQYCTPLTVQNISIFFLDLLNGDNPWRNWKNEQYIQRIIEK